MKIFGDYHTHTVYSHGKGTIRENVEAARDRGLREIAITDHGSGHLLYGVKRENFAKMRREIDTLNKEFDDIRVLLGVEANVLSLDGQIDVDDELREMIDILLVGFHFAAKPKTVKDAYDMYILNKLCKYSERLSEKSVDKNTKAMINAINLITHPGAKLNVDIIKIARAASKRNTALEINSHHGHLTVDELRVAMNENVKFMINSDAHRKEDVGNVQEGINRAIEVGLDKSQILNVE